MSVISETAITNVSIWRPLSKREMSEKIIAFRCRKSAITALGTAVNGTLMFSSDKYFGVDEVGMVNYVGERDESIYCFWVNETFIHVTHQFVSRIVKEGSLVLRAK